MTTFNNSLQFSAIPGKFKDLARTFLDPDGTMPSTAPAFIGFKTGIAFSIMVSETNNKSNILALKTLKLPTVFLEEMKPISSNLIPINSHQDGQLTLQGDRIVTTENVKPMMDYYFKPSLGGMGMWQKWMDLYNEFAIIWIRFSLNWFDLFWKVFGRPTAADWKSTLEGK